MKNFAKYSLGVIAALLCMALGACSDFEPTGMPDVPTLPKVSNLTAQVVGHDVNLSWNLPAANDIKEILVVLNADNANPIVLPATATSYVVKGQPIGKDVIYTVKVRYNDGYTSEGISITTALPDEQLNNVSNLTATVDGRSVTLKWSFGSTTGVTGVRIITNGVEATAIALEGAPTTYTMKGQPIDSKMTYTVQAVYDTYYYASGANVQAVIPYIEPKMAYLMLAPTIADLPDDDEIAAASWFVQQPNAELVQIADLADLDAGIYSVLWVEVDRVGLPMGWENLPANLVSESALDALRAYSANGGSLYLANMATQLTVPLGVVPENMAPTVYGNGDGGTGDDVWVINPNLGWDFRDGADQGFYDRTVHEIYQGLTLEDPNGYGYPNLPLIGPGQREDHNCMWDCNLYGRGTERDVIAHFEVTTNSLVLATWGHVRDHCVAGMVEFFANAQHGRVIANGLAAYEWNQNSGTNPYQHNIEQLTTNILNYLK